MEMYDNKEIALYVKEKLAQQREKKLSKVAETLKPKTTQLPEKIEMPAKNIVKVVKTPKIEPVAKRKYTKRPKTFGQRFDAFLQSFANLFR